MVLRELENLPRIIIGRYNLNDIKYAIVSLFMADLERKLRILIYKLIMEDNNEEASINYKKAEYTICQQSRQSSVRFEDIKIK